MNKDLKLLGIIILTLALAFATTLLLELKIVQAELIRKFIVYLAVALELFIGFVVVKFQIK